MHVKSNRKKKKKKNQNRHQMKCFPEFFELSDKKNDASNNNNQKKTREKHKKIRISLAFWFLGAIKSGEKSVIPFPLF